MTRSTEPVAGAQRAIALDITALRVPPARPSPPLRSDCQHRAWRVSQRHETWRCGTKYPKRRAIALFEAPSAIATSTSSSRRVNRARKALALNNSSANGASLNNRARSCGATTTSPTLTALMAAIISLRLADRSRTACAPALSARTVFSLSVPSSRTTKGIRSRPARYSANSSWVGTSATRTSTPSRLSSSLREDAGRPFPR